MGKIAILVPTLARPVMLANCLDSIANQELVADNPGDVCVVVGDNNPDLSASEYVNSIAPGYPCDISAVPVPVRGLCANRNALFDHALSLEPDFLVLIDDDQRAEPGWLQALVEAISATNADACMGPVQVAYHASAPEWFRQSGIGLSTRNGVESGSPSPKLAAHNVIIRRTSLRGLEPPWFPLEFNSIGSEDRYFFEHARTVNLRSILWSAEASVIEEMPIDRCTTDYFVRRSLQRGSSGVLAERLVRRHSTGSDLPPPWLRTLREIARLAAGLPGLFLFRYRYRLLRHALFIAGRLGGHIGKFESLYAQGADDGSDNGVGSSLHA